MEFLPFLEILSGLLSADIKPETGQILTILPPDVSRIDFLKFSGVVVVWFVSLLYIYIRFIKLSPMVQKVIVVIKWIVRIGTAILAAIAAVNTAGGV